jgi:hypothetical protein
VEAGLAAARAAALAAAATIAAAGLAACTGGGKSAPGAGSQVPNGAGSGAVAAPAVVTDVASAEANVGKQVEVRGVADDAKLGAEVTAGTLVVYCLLDQRWPADVAGKQVAARGLLERTDEFAAEPDPALPSAGTSGAVWVLRGCAFEGPK